MSGEYIYMLKAIGSRVDLSTVNPDSEEYLSLVSDLMESDIVCRMKDYTQHGSTSTFQHCVNVSYYNYLICKLFSLNARAGARAGLLHDLFLYDWHTHVVEKGERLHGFTHAATALANAKQYFLLSELECDIIEKHMFPLNIALPRYRETVVIIMVDKFCGLLETIAGIKYSIKRTGSLIRKST